MTVRRRKASGASKEARLGAQDAIARATAGLPDGSLRIDWSKLDPPEVEELVGLVQAAWAEGGLNLDGLAKAKQRRFEELAERGAGREPGYFDALKEQARLKTKLTRLAVKVRRPSPRPRFEQPGAVVLPKEWVFDFARDGILWARHLSLLTLLLAQWEAGETLSRHAHFEGSGDDTALVLDTRTNLFGRAAGAGDDGGLSRWKKDLHHLEKNHFVAIDKQGPIWKVRRGSRTLKALSERAAA